MSTASLLPAGTRAKRKLSIRRPAAWLAARGVDGAPAESRTLAELFAQAEGIDPAEQALVGFGDE